MIAWLLIMGLIASTLPEADLAERAALALTHPVGTTATGWTTPYPRDDPRSLLLEYQHRWTRDMSRFKIGMMARQTGKDFSSEGEAVEDCYRSKKSEWLIAAPSERQSLKAIEKAKEWAQAYDLRINDYVETRGKGSGTLLKSAEIIFENGSRIEAVPGKPETVRGPSANLLLTEADHFEQPLETWRALLPVITNPMRGGQKRVRIVGTPNGLGGLMHRIWTQPDGGKVAWSKHLVTIYDAVLQGFPVDLAELREAFRDADGWAQEYECQFIDTASVLLPYDLIAACESSVATEAPGSDYWGTTPAHPRMMGIDFGRSKDLTVAWTCDCVSDLRITREVLCLAKTSTPEQVSILSPRIKHCTRVSLDYNGPGVGLGDYLVREHGEWAPERHRFGKVELVAGTNQNKVDSFSKLRMAFEGRTVRIPSSIAIREDLHAVYRCTTPTGATTYRAPHNDDGHSDRATALALCVRAAGVEVKATFEMVLIT